MTHLVPPAAQLLAFLVVTGLLTITPGADMALVMRHALGSGRRQAFFASLGIGLGCLIWGTASALGVAVVLAHSALAFTVLKYVGGAYLIYLGAQALWSAVRSESTTKRAKDTEEESSSRFSNLRGYPSECPRRGPSRSACFTQGLLTNLLNPKVAVFYLTFLPQFVASDRPVLPQSLFLATTHVLIGLVWLTLYARFLDRMAAVLLSSRVKRRIEAVTGAVLMALGIRLALAKH
jgi:threonine/homoserine/homoserine lactone efflux protein